MSGRPPGRAPRPGYNAGSHARVERHRQPAAHRLSDAGQPADDRAGGRSRAGRRMDLYAPHPRGPQGRPDASSCTTGRRTPTATSTSAPRSTRSSRTSSSSRATMAGFDAPYVPGWDCHGLPIELKVDRELGPKKRADERRRLPPRLPRLRRDVRRHQMRGEFKRLGVLGDWDEPYLTMNFGYQAAIVARAGHASSSRAWSTRARSRCTGARTAAPRSPRPRSSTRTHTSPSIYVEFPLAPSSARRARGAHPGAGRARASRS